MGYLGDHQFCATCLLGLEGLVAQELRDMGCEGVQAENGRVLFAGDERALARASLGLRCAERVLVLVGEFEARSFEELFQGVKALEWDGLLPKDAQFPVSGASLSSQLHSVPDCQAIIKKAIVERLGARYGVSWFEETGPVYRVRFRLMKDKVSLMVDASGAGLHKRGYRPAATQAPIKETLAAALAMLARVRRDGHFIDPFCGSGTLLIEAAMLARQIAPGLGRRFMAETWSGSDKGLWKQERLAARERVLPGTGFSAEGFDIDPQAVELAAQNAARAGVGGQVRTAVRDIADFDGASQYGCVVCNPPYGERLLDVESARELCRVMGRVFARKRGWSYGVITPEEDFEELFGRRADKRRKLYNGMIKCQFYQYFK